MRVRTRIEPSAKISAGEEITGTSHVVHKSSKFLTGAEEDEESVEEEGEEDESPAVALPSVALEGKAKKLEVAPAALVSGPIVMLSLKIGTFSSIRLA